MPAVAEGVLDRLARSFRLFVAVDCNRYTPLYGRLGTSIADDLELLELLAQARPGQQRPVLFLAAVHDLLLAGADGDLGRWYPSVSGAPVPPGDPFPPFRAFCLDHRAALLDLLSTRSTQTNEVNRSVALRAGVAAAVADVPDVPLALVDLGASAGLNLRFDHYALAGRFGPPGSTVQLACDVVGDGVPPFDRHLPPVVWRRGIDQRPVSVTDDRELRWLEACLWPEQVERVARFRAAVALARSEPPVIVAGDVIDDLGSVVADAPDGAHLVLMHSWVLTYLERSRRADLAEAIGAVASGGRSVTWLSAEAPGVVPGLEPPSIPDDADQEVRLATILGMQRFRGGRATGANEVIARCHPHLRWLEWLAVSGEARRSARRRR